MYDFIITSICFTSVNSLFILCISVFLLVDDFLKGQGCRVT